jgi:predicted nucleotide-binding protein (sugar kinase/HSP70/actin superfamily)
MIYAKADINAHIERLIQKHGKEAVIAILEEWLQNASDVQGR